MKNNEKGGAIKREAKKVAFELVEHAKETARQMLLGTALDISKIPLICNKIVKIQNDIAWLKWLFAGIGTVLLYLVFKK